MKKLFFLLIIVFLVSLSAFAQRFEITYLLNGYEVDKDEMGQIDTTMIQSVSMLRDIDIEHLYSPSVIKGAVMVETKPIKKIKGIVRFADGTMARGTFVRNITTGAHTFADHLGKYEIAGSKNDSIEYIYAQYPMQTLSVKTPIKNIQFPSRSNRSLSEGGVNYILFINNKLVESFDGVRLPSSTKDIVSVHILKDTASTILSNWRTSVLFITTKERTDSDYQATVMDAGFDTFLGSQPSKEFYSETVLKGKNSNSVSLWNTRCKNASVYDSSIYASIIDYEPRNNYGLDVEYTLYMFFRFMEMKHGIKI